MSSAEKHDGFFNEELKVRIAEVLSGCENRIEVRAVLKENDNLSDKMLAFLNEFAQVTDKVDVRIIDMDENEKLVAGFETKLYPVISIMDRNGRYSGISFNALPVGHEFESFILAIYTMAGEGQHIDDELKNRISRLPAMNIMVGATMSCVLCPSVVQACQRISSINPKVLSSLVDISYFPEIRKRHKIMSVPVVIVDDSDVYFGKKNLEEIVTLLESGIK